MHSSFDVVLRHETKNDCCQLPYPVNQTCCLQQTGWQPLERLISSVKRQEVSETTGHLVRAHLSPQHVMELSELV
jgi:hypothetical protein